MAFHNKTLLVIAGPTAAGKTAVSLDVAAHFGTEIISADSRQCFRELDIGVARPVPSDLERISHHFIASHSVKDEINAARFESLALGWAEEIFSRQDLAVMVGGTGLYIKAFCEGLDAIPDIPPALRRELQEQYANQGLSWLQSRIRELDPEYQAKGDTRNPQRMLRALEVRLATGHSLYSFRNIRPAPRPFTIKKYGISLPKEILHRNIHARVDQMMDRGLLEEVKRLSPFRSLNALQTVGYREIFSYLDGMISLDEAIEQVRLNTRHYAKRQMTWFRKDKTITWLETGDWKKIIKA